MRQNATGGDAPPPTRPAGVVQTPPAGTGPAGSTRAACAPDRPPVPRDLGMATAEYAITTLAACGFAGLLLVLLRGGEVRGLLLGLVRRALSVD